MKDVFNSLQTATFTALDGNLTLGSTNVPLYDRVPVDAVKPYVRVLTFNSTDSGSCKDHWIHTVLQQIDIVTEYTGSAGGKEDCAVIAAQILPVLVPDSTANYLDLSGDGLNLYIAGLDLDRSFEEEIGNDTVQITRVLQVRYEIEEI